MNISFSSLLFCNVSPFKLKHDFFLLLLIKGAVSRNSAKLGNYKMPVKLGET